MPNVTDELAAILTPLLPKSWKWTTTETNIQAADTVNIVLTPNRLEHEPAAPKKNQRVTFQLSVIQPGIDYAETEGALFENVQTVLTKIDQLRTINPDLSRGVWWDSATKAVWPDTGNLCWQITLYAITEQKD